MMNLYSESRLRSRSSMRRNRNLNPYVASATAMGPVSLSFVLIAIVAILALLYLTQITKTTVYGYQVNELSTQRQELLNRNQELQVEAARLQAIARIEQSPVAQALESDNGATIVTSQAN